MRGLIVAIIALTVAGCGPRPLTPVEFAGLEAPPGTVVLSEEVDQMIVGDRLMDSGEFELALRAYYRAGLTNGIDADLLNAIGLANLSLGRLGQAEVTFRNALNEDETHVPALNNLGVVLIERGDVGEARRIFEQAFALDSGRSDSIRENLRFAIAQMENTVYDASTIQNGPGLIRRGGGVYTLERGQ
ncbi:MAG: tetratricopeptide repeat protein [Pseudomonadota bacterium]